MNIQVLFYVSRKVVKKLRFRIKKFECNLEIGGKCKIFFKARHDSANVDDLAMFRQKTKP